MSISRAALTIILYHTFRHSIACVFPCSNPLGGSRSPYYRLKRPWFVPRPLETLFAVIILIPSIHSSASVQGFKFGQGAGTISQLTFKTLPTVLRRMGSNLIRRVQYRNSTPGTTKNIVSIHSSILHLNFGQLTTLPCRAGLLHSALRSMTRNLRLRLNN